MEVEGRKTADIQKRLYTGRGKGKSTIATGIDIIIGVVFFAYFYRWFNKV